MNRRLLSLVLAVSASAFAQTPAPVQNAATTVRSTPGRLNVTDVIRLHHAGIGDSVIQAQLAQQNHPMSLTTDDLLQLKAEGVSDEVVRAMIVPAPAPRKVVVDNTSIDRLHSLNPTGATPTYGAPTPPSTNPLAPHDSGVYMASTSAAGSAQFRFMDRAAITGIAENAGSVFSFFAYPLTIRYVVQPPKASIRTTNQQPSFYFYFEDKSAGLGKSGFAAANVSTPNQFQLIRFDAGKKQRTMPALKFGIFIGVSNGEKPIAFTTERLSDGVYKVTPTAPLKPGEYTFVSPMPQSRGNQAPVNDPNAPKPDLFDFAVDAS